MLACLMGHHRLILSGVYSIAMLCAGLLMLRKKGLSHEVSRIARGRRESVKRLAVKQLQRHLKQLTTSAYQGGTILGVDVFNGGYVTLSDRAANLHTLVTGVTGSGKTTTLETIVESVITRQLPLVYVDGKGDQCLLKRIQQLANIHKRSCYVFSMIGESLHYNPLAFGGYTSKKDRVIGLRHWSEDHYRILAEGYLQTVLKILDERQIPIDLATLATYLEPDALYGLAREVKDAALITRIEKLENQYNDMASLIGEIQNMIQSEIGHLFVAQHHPTLTLHAAIEENAVIIFSLQPLRFPAYAETLGKLIINDIKAVVSEKLMAVTKTPIYTIFDEFSLFAGEQIVNLINQGRSAGVHAILATQSLADIKKAGGDALLGQILNNCNNFIIQRQNNPDDAELLANVIGTEHTFDVTSQVATTKGSTGVGTVRQTREFMIHPDDIKRLKVGEAIYVNKQVFGVKVILTRYIQHHS